MALVSLSYQVAKKLSGMSMITTVLAFYSAWFAAGEGVNLMLHATNQELVLDTHFSFTAYFHNEGKDIVKINRDTPPAKLSIYDSEGNEVEGLEYMVVFFADHPKPEILLLKPGERREAGHFSGALRIGEWQATHGPEKYEGLGLVMTHVAHSWVYPLSKGMYTAQVRISVPESKGKNHFHGDLTSQKVSFRILVKE